MRYKDDMFDEIEQQKETIEALRTKLAEARRLMRPVAHWAGTIYKEQDDNEFKDMCLEVGQIRAISAFLDADD